MKIRPVESELFHADSRIEGRKGGQTDMTKLILFLRKFEKASKNKFHYPILLLLTGLINPLTPN